MEQLAIQQQIELLQQQQQQIQATQQQYMQNMNMGILPQGQPVGGFNPLQQQMANIGQNAFQFQNQLQQQQMGVPMGAPTQPLSHRRNQSAMPNMSMGPPPAPSSGASGNGLNEFNNAGRENQSLRGGRGGNPAGGHHRRHSLALPEAKKAAELAQQKRTTSGFQFPIPGAAGATPTSATTENSTEEKPAPQAPSAFPPHLTGRSGRGGHGRSQSMAVGGRGAGSMRGGGSFQFPAPINEGTATQGTDFQRKGSLGHNRNSSRNFEGNWRNQSVSESSTQPQQQQMGSFGQGQQAGQFQPGHRSRASMNQSMGSLGAFQYQPQFVQLPGTGQVALVQPPMQPIFPGQQLNPLQLNQLQALQQINNQQQQFNNMQGGQHGGQNQNQNQQQQRKTLFTPYLPQASLPALLANGQLVAGILRVNKKNRSDAYVTTQDGLLDADIFICGSKDRNRALEGDLVAVELLDVDEVWSQKREKEEKKKRKDITDTRGGSLNGNNDRSNRESSNGDDNTATEGGLRRRGSLKQRPTQKKNDDVEVEGQSLLLVEEEEVNDEQKPLYAGHIVAVIERTPGQMFSGTLGLLRPSSQATKEKQEAERQARDGDRGRHYEQRQQEKPKIVWFKPTDKRVPLIAIPTEQAPRDFVENHQHYADRIFVACIKRWPITSLHPFGTLVEQLGQMGELKIETDALLRDNNFASDEFSDAVIRNVGLDDWTLAKEDQEALQTRRDFRDEKTFTIDPNGVNELDDAIHIKSETDGKIEIGIHIADIAHFIKHNSLVDREAKKRGTAVYLMNRSCNMLPPKIVNEVCALIPGEERLTVSVVFKVNALSGAIAEDDVWVGKSIIKSIGKLSYREVDAVISGQGNVKLEGITNSDVTSLQNIAQKFREARLGSEGEIVAPLRLLHQLDDENVPVEQNIFDSTPSHELIEELMHKANFYVAQKIVKAFPEKALLRRQNPPNARRLQTFAERMARIGYEIDTSSSGTLQKSLFKIDDDDIRKGMETLLIKAIPRAKYFVAGKYEEPARAHYTLNLPLYTHFTNPSRRYADIVVHRQLESALSEGKIEFTEDMDNLVKTTEACNNKKDSAKNAQEQSVHIESCRVMDKKREDLGDDLISEGIVLCVYESAFDVLIPEFGFEKRVHCDQLPLKKAEFRKNERVLELYWEKGVQSSAYIPEDERPRAGLSQRATAASVAAREAAVAERARKDREEATRKQMETGTMSADAVDALFDSDEDEDDEAQMAAGLQGVSIADRPTQSVPPSPTKGALAEARASDLHRARSDSKVPTADVAAAEKKGESKRYKYMKYFTLREEGGDYIQDVKEMTRVPVILKTDLSKSPP